MTTWREETAGEIAAYSAYGALVSLAAIPGALVAAAGAALSPRWRYGILERAGFVKPEVRAAARKSPRIWLHAASIGEVRAAQPLLARLREARPDVGVLLTTMTPEGNRTAASLGLADAVSMLPLDSWGGPARLLDALQPDALVLLETELWPGLLRAARRRLIPVLVVNGRISARSFGRYAAARTLLAPVLDDVAVFAMQAEVDRARILSLGADPSRVELHGNLKYDAVSLPQPPPPKALESLRGEVAWVAGSTHDGEEAAVADAFLEIRRSLPDVRLVIAPRHKQRADEAARTLEARGLSVARRSTLTGAPPKGAVVLLDTSGELTAVYGLASAVFVGGSLVPRGGHNPLEPVAHGVPVAFGPHTANFEDVAKVVLASGGGVRVRDAASLAATTRGWLADPAAARALGAAARGRIVRNYGAAEKAVALLERWLGARAPVTIPPAEWLDLDHRPAARLAARLAARAYRGAVAMRRALYDHRVIPVARVGLPVISLGGIVAGGTGKTPAAIWFAQRLAALGRKPAVVSRGFRGTPGPAPRVVSAGAWNDGDPHAPPRPGVEQAGDEPLLIAARAPESAVVVHPDRVAAANIAELLGADVVLLDDGFQHRRLARDLDVVLLDAAAPFGNGRFLPAGPLRDLPQRLGDAGLVLLTRAESAGEGATARAAARVALATSAPIARFAHRLARFERVHADGGRVAIAASALALKRPYAFAGIADPAGFFAMLERVGVGAVGLREFADHRAFTAADVAALEDEARAAGGEALLTTEKDAVRVPATQVPLYVAVLEFAPVSDEDAAIVDRVLRRAVSRP